MPDPDPLQEAVERAATAIASNRRYEEAAGCRAFLESNFDRSDAQSALTAAHVPELLAIREVLTELLAYLKRYRACDPTLDPEEWYIETESAAALLDRYDRALEEGE